MTTQPNPSQDPNFVEDPTKIYDVFGNVVGNKPPANRYGTGNEVEDYYTGQDTTPYTPTEETDVFEQQRQLQQSNIDALNAIYNRQVQEAQQEGEQSLARGSAILSRQGLRGTGMGGAQQEGRRAETTAKVAGIDERRALAITQIMSKADDRASKLIEAEKTRALGAEEDYINYKQGIQTESRDDFKNLASTGNMDWSMLDEDDQEMWKQQTGYSDFQADYVFNTYKPEAEQIKYEYVWKGNNLVGMGLDPTTGQMVETQTYSAEEMGIPREVSAGFITDKQTGDVFWYDKDNPSAGLQLMGQISPEREAGTGLTAEMKNYSFYANQETSAGRTPKSFGEWSGKVDSSGNTTLFDSIMQSAIDGGANSSDAALVAVQYAENNGITINADERAGLVNRASGMTPIQQEEISEPTSPIDGSIERLKNAGMSNLQTRAQLARDGFSQEEINNSSVGSIISKTGSFFSGLFGD